MKRSVRPPFLEFLEPCYSGVLDDPAIDELRGTVRGQDRDHAWNVIQDQAPIALALAQRFIGCGELAGPLRDPCLQVLVDSPSLASDVGPLPPDARLIRYAFTHWCRLPCLFAASPSCTG
jgi:hypothetical protein